ncbi:23S rRNA (guanosine(2251)-2'-O)-methyltransferase RlmB [Beggiatoa leptomitoformis]|uniref:23S rRNA (guanosine-2'-O-)-methyltransferase RlmB n=1 Tax=Beggiatoa leptomitoformis TaxID=288004 RepID=A0A2N9YIY4_9GAMM|nr:23S rRNA (guanosine(2251)-2'-O)-methyltransferase RlmB [Beggiatoa leptomitoformis]ALG67345.1 23S rRNA (guanosine(2251)-2'-O)-methyltransferase RlmB [Beggiatoa leptomitoformis]AUI70454.1 23S rRNA (guanosine(2251)-2'-O)-methyltransferase RlmB [Beggiatoa leptomitoformis]
MQKSRHEIIFGIHAVQAVLQTDASRILEVWIQEGRHDARMEALLTQVRQQGLTLQTVSKKTLDKQVDEGSNHQGIIARCKAQAMQTQDNLEELLAQLDTPPFLLILDTVQDPHNLGACLRTADAAGVHAVIVPKDKACGLSPVVRKVASGGAENVPLIQVTNLATTVRWLKEQGVWIIGTAGESKQSLFATELTGALAIVLGAEGTGLRRLTQELCDTLVNIPMFGHVESLNVSVATGVCLYEAVRQRTR